jgi:surface protein
MDSHLKCEYHIFLLTDLCLHRYCYDHHLPFPVEMQSIIKSYLYARIDSNDMIREAVKLWCSGRESTLIRYGHISYWDTRKVTDMSDLFRNQESFNDNINNWDVSNVTTMSNMFFRKSYNQPLDRWNVGIGTNIFCMFGRASSFNDGIDGMLAKLLTWVACSVMYLCLINP